MNTKDLKAHIKKLLDEHLDNLEQMLCIATAQEKQTLVEAIQAECEETDDLLDAIAFVGKRTSPTQVEVFYYPQEPSELPFIKRVGSKAEIEALLGGELEVAKVDPLNLLDTLILGGSPTSDLPPNRFFPQYKGAVLRCPRTWEHLA